MNEILKQIPRSCQIVLLNFYNVIWCQGLLPSDWKDAIITPLLKPNKSPFGPASYHPVALRPQPTKRTSWKLQGGPIKTAHF